MPLLLEKLSIEQLRKALKKCHGNPVKRTVLKERLKQLLQLRLNERKTVNTVIPNTLTPSITTAVVEEDFDDDMLLAEIFDGSEDELGDELEDDLEDDLSILEELGSCELIEDDDGTNIQPKPQSARPPISRDMLNNKMMGRLNSEIQLRKTGIGTGDFERPYGSGGTDEYPAFRQVSDAHPTNFSN